LLAAAVAALVWVNVDASSYDSLWETTLSIEIGDAGVSLDLRHWVNSGLMTFFFFVVGLEARREFDLGELRERRRFALPLLAGIGGMAVAVAIYLAFNAGRSSAHGWGIAMSTDTAFALGLLAAGPGGIGTPRRRGGTGTPSPSARGRPPTRCISARLDHRWIGRSTTLRWLLVASGRARHILEPSPAEVMVARPASPDVNSVRNDYRELIQVAAEKTPFAGSPERMNGSTKRFRSTERGPKGAYGIRTPLLIGGSPGASAAPRAAPSERTPHNSLRAACAEGNAW
jgi:Na+/H+ antiporter 1